MEYERRVNEDNHRQQREKDDTSNALMHWMYYNEQLEFINDGESCTECCTDVHRSIYRGRIRVGCEKERYRSIEKQGSRILINDSRYDVLNRTDSMPRSSSKSLNTAVSSSVVLAGSKWKLKPRIEVPNSETYLNDMNNQSVHALQDFKQSPVMVFLDNEISSDSNIIPHSQYLQETQQATVQDTNLQAKQDSMILFVIEQISREKMIDSQMDDLIKEKLTLKEQVDSLEQNLSKQIKENESLLQTFAVFKNESKEKENKYMENEIDLEKKIKELDNIICKKAQRIKPTLYDGVVMSNTHVAMPVIDDEETLILEEESRSKMSEKAKDPEVIAKKISHTPIDYEKLNRLTEDFGKHFFPQQELSTKQAFWFHILNPTIEPSYTSPVIVNVPSELPKKDSDISWLKSELEKVKLEKESYQLKIEIFENASKSLDQLLRSQIIDKSRKGVGFVSYNVVPPSHTGFFSPLKIDLSNSGLEEFQESEFEGYGPKTSKSASEDISNEVRKSNDASLIEKLVSDDKS
ncbi:hypothetical protein Tco_1019517 [Tanacetum coccineum]|uniref:Uncharacterized protein n=1 Tax=Tanacetum coccineum TaxID=301880 RepID=A0ABQ5FZA4_9ASTR